MEFSVGDRVNHVSWKHYKDGLEVVKIDASYNKICIKENETTAWYDVDGFTKVESTEKPSTFMVGDTVWCVVHGQGVVQDIGRRCLIYPINVKLANGSVSSYTLDGKLYTHSNRTLFFSKPEVKGDVVRKFVSTLIGKTVVIQYFDDTWSQPVVVTAETADTISSESGTIYKSDLLQICEVKTENALRK